MAKLKKKYKSQVEYVWLIAYIEPEFLHKAKRQLKNHSDVTIWVPTVKILRKVFKGKPHYDKVPLLFNYGFFKMPNYLAFNSEYLEKLQRQVTCITSWVKDTAKVKSDVKVGDRKAKTRYAPVATASAEEVSTLLSMQKGLAIHDKKAVKNLKPGTIVKLKGYPFEGLEAKIVSVDKKAKKVEVSLEGAGLISHVTVSFDNLIYSIYQGGYNDSLSNLAVYDENKSAKALTKIYAQYESEF